jgi:hypothetical protein
MNLQGKVAIVTGGNALGRRLVDADSDARKRGPARSVVAQCVGGAFDSECTRAALRGDLILR